MATRYKAEMSLGDEFDRDNSWLEQQIKTLLESQLHLNVDWVEVNEAEK